MGGAVSSIFGGAEHHGKAPSSSSSSRVLTFDSKERWESHYNKIKDSSKLVVIDFTASWCGPCRFIAPVFNAMAENLTDVEFIKIDVDQLKEVAEKFNVEAMPTFVLLKKGKEVERVVGANKEELEKKIKKHRG